MGLLDRSLTRFAHESPRGPVHPCAPVQPRVPVHPRAPVHYIACPCALAPTHIQRGAEGGRGLGLGARAPRRPPRSGRPGRSAACLLFGAALAALAAPGPHLVAWVEPWALAALAALAPRFYTRQANLHQVDRAPGMGRAPRAPRAQRAPRLANPTARRGQSAARSERSERPDLPTQKPGLGRRCPSPDSLASVVMSTCSGSASRNAPSSIVSCMTSSLARRKKTASVALMHWILELLKNSGFTRLGLTLTHADSEVGTGGVDAGPAAGAAA